MPDSLPLNRRQLLAGTAAVAALSAMPAYGQQSDQAAPDLSGTSILITGCSSGFGYLGALLYARAGARVIATMRNLPRPEAETLRSIASDENLDLHVVEIDVLSDEQVSVGVTEAERIAGGPLDVLVNNAGIGMAGPMELQDMAAMEAMFGTNVFGYQRMARAVLPGMRSRGSGFIINVSSQLGRVVVPNIGSYCPTKFAVEAMSEQMAYELVARGVDLTIVEPGGFPTNIWESGNRYTNALLDRTSDERKAAYPSLVSNSLRGGGGTTDPADVPRAIAALIAMPAGSRPLRRPVHPIRRPQEAINRVSAEVQRAMLGNSPYGPWVESVLD